jgi:hypothetical protein
MELYVLHGPGSSVGIATGYGLDGPGIEKRLRGSRGLCAGLWNPKIAGSLPTESVGFFVMEKSTARSTIGRERTIEHKEHETNK